MGARFLCFDVCFVTVRKDLKVSEQRFWRPICDGLTYCLFAPQVTMTISLTLTIVVFLLLVSKILPPADHMPLISKFLLFIFIMNLISVFVTVITINLNYRGPRTHNMPKWLRYVFLDFFPPILLMKRPTVNFLKRRKPERSPRESPVTTRSYVSSPAISLIRRSFGFRDQLPLTNHIPLNPITVPGLRYMDDDSVDGDEHYELMHHPDGAIVADSVEKIVAHMERSNEIKLVRVYRSTVRTRHARLKLLLRNTGK